MYRIEKKIFKDKNGKFSGMLNCVAVDTGGFYEIFPGRYGRESTYSTETKDNIEDVEIDLKNTINWTREFIQGKRLEEIKSETIEI